LLSPAHPTPDLNLQLRTFTLAHGQQRVIPATDYAAGASVEAERLWFPWGEEECAEDVRSSIRIFRACCTLSGQPRALFHTFDFSIGRVLLVGVENGTIYLHMYRVEKEGGGCLRSFSALLLEKSTDEKEFMASPSSLPVYRTATVSPFFGTRFFSPVTSQDSC
jgi:hypothetical protein